MLLCSELTLDSPDESGDAAGPGMPDGYGTLGSSEFFIVTAKTITQIANIRITITTYIAITAGGTPRVLRHSCGRLL